MTDVLTKTAIVPSAIWKAFVGVALLVVLGFLVKTGLDLAGSPSPLNQLAIELTVFALIGMLIYVRLGNVNTERLPALTRVGGQRSQIFGLVIGYVVSMTLSVWLLRESLYVPSSLYYVTLALAVTFVGLEIVLWSRIGKGATGLVLLQLISIGALIQISFAWLNPRSIGGDLFADWLGIQGILQSGSIPEALGYFLYFPSFHVYNAASASIGEVGIDSYLLLNHLIVIIAIPAIYLLAREVLSNRKALASALFLLVSIFFFLSAVVLPVLLGASILLLAIYALLRYEKMRTRNWAVAFWVLAIFVFFSHPVNALIFSIILVAAWINNRIHRTPSTEVKFTEPTATYGVGYLGYLVFIAASAFTIFVESLFDSGPRYYFARVAPAPQVSIPAVFYAQTFLSTLGFSILFLFAAVALLSWLFKGNPNRRFVLGVVIALMSVPAFIVILGRGPYGLQAARTLLYIGILLVIPAASGFVYLSRRMGRGASRIAMVAIVFFTVAMLSSTSYLTASGNRFLSDAVPIETTYVTDSMIAVGGFLDRLPAATPLTLDPALAFFLAPEGSGVTYPVTPFPIAHTQLIAFSDGLGNTSIALALSSVYLSNGGYEAPDTSFLDEIYELRVYDSGQVRIYLPRGIRP